MLILMFFAFWVDDILSNSYRSWPKWGVLIGIGLVFITWLALQAFNISNLGLRCPHCKKAIDYNVGHVVIASGNCGECGKQILDKSAAEQVAAPDASSVLASARSLRCAGELGRSAARPL
jgi:hypothetical protein